MSEEITNEGTDEAAETTSETVTESNPNDGELPKYTDAQVQDIVKKRLAAERRRAQKAAQQPTQAKSPGTEQPNQELAELAEIKREMQRLKFETAAAKSGITDDKSIDLLRKAWMSDGAESPYEWLAEHSSLVVRSVPAEVPEQAARPAQATKAVADNGSPTRTSLLDQPVIDVLKLGREDIKTLQAQGRFKEVLDKYRDSLGGPGSNLFARGKKKK